MYYDHIVTLKLRQKLESTLSFNIIQSSQTGSGHIPAEQYPNGQGKRETQVIGKKEKQTIKK